MNFQSIKFLPIILGVILIASSILLKEPKDLSSIPVPTEIIQKKERPEKIQNGTERLDGKYASF